MNDTLTTMSDETFEKTLMFVTHYLSSLERVIIPNFCILCAKHLEKLKNKNKNTNFNVDFLGYLSHLKYILKIEENINIKNNQKLKFIII